MIDWLIDWSYVQEALVIVDKMYSEVPDLMKDANWDQKLIQLPVTEATAAFKKVDFIGSTAGVQWVIIIIIFISQLNIK